MEILRKVDCFQKEVSALRPFEDGNGRVARLLMNLAFTQMAIFRP